MECTIYNILYNRTLPIDAYPSIKTLLCQVGEM